MEETSSNNKKPDEIEYIPEEETLKADGKIGKLKKELEICKSEKEEYLKGWQRAKADYTNAERMFRDREAGSIEIAKEKMIRDILDIADGFDQAFSASPPDSKWTDGIRQLSANLKSILSKHGVEEIHAEGKDFDPNMHEAIELEEVKEEKHDGRVLAEYQKGYIRNGRVIRPSKVKVGKYNA